MSSIPLTPTPAVPPTEVYISFSAEVNPNTTESLLAAMANCVNSGVPRVILLLSTPGGAVMNGINLYNVLKALPIELHTHNVGNVDSIGNVVFLAGAKRFACPHSTFMFHGVGYDFNGAIRFAEANLREHLEGVLAEQKRIGAIIQQHTNLNETDVAALFTAQQTKDATYAVGCGIVDEVREVQIPPGAPVISLVFQR